MNKYLVLALIILALVPIMALAAYGCEECDSRGYECGTLTIGDANFDCGSCSSDEHCVNGLCREDCDSHDEKRCYKGDVYWYDSCGNRENKYDSCEDYCSEGKCRDDYYDRDYWDDDHYSGYWHDGYYYSYNHDSYYRYDSYNRCDHFCNYPSVCSETGYDGCGQTCRRLTDGVGCGTGGVCSEGTCITKQKTQPVQEVVVQGLMPYTYAPYSAPMPRAKSICGGDLPAIILLAFGCIIFLLGIGALFGWLIRR